MHKRKGFTTVELVIVIAVIAILAVALIPTFAGLIKSANHNSDLQMARNLTSVVKMYGLKYEINDMADLRDAINEGMGDDFYDELEPVSAKDGYCYWYDYNKCQIHIGTVDEIIEIKNQQLSVISDRDILMSNELIVSNKFDTGNLRSQLIPGFVLMGNNTENPLIKLIVDLENVTSTDSYETAYNAVLNFSDNNADATQRTVEAVGSLAKAIAEIPILNAHGLFLPKSAIDAATAETDSVKITNIHIPLVPELGSIKIFTNVEGVTYDKPISNLLADNFKLKLPRGTVYGSDILKLERIESQDAQLLTGSDEIHVDIEQSQLGDHFGADTIDAVIVIADGSRYIQDGSRYWKLTATGQEQLGAEISSKEFGTLSDYNVTITPNDANGKNYIKAIFLNKDEEAQTEYYNLYVSWDHQKNSTVSVSGFTGTVSGQPADIAVRNVSILLNGQPITNKGLSTDKIPNLAENDTILVSSRGVNMHYTVKELQVVASTEKDDNGNNIGFQVGSIGGNTVDNNTVEVTYNSTDKSWTTGYTAPLNLDVNALGIADLDIDTSLKVNGNAFSMTNRTLAVDKFDLTGGGDQTATVTFACANANVDITLKLYDNSLTAFAPSLRVQNMKAKGNFFFNGDDELPVDFVVGTINDITLGDLFDKVSTKFTQFSISTSLSEVEQPTNKNWAEYEVCKYLTDHGVNLSRTQRITFYLHAYKSEAKAQVNLLIVPNAYNVRTAEDWLNAPSGKDIVVIGEMSADKKSVAINIPEVNVTATQITEQNITSPSKVPYSLELGSATLYGNFIPINVPKFMVYNGSHNHFINVGGGTLDHVIINGPMNYKNVVIIASLQGETWGTDVSAVHATTPSDVNKKTVTIKDSYISGFRTPLTLQTSQSLNRNGIADITNTTLYGGNLANINIIDGPVTLTLTNVITMQPQPGGDDPVGIGIFIKNNVGDKTQIKANNLKQYNFTTLDTLVKFATGAISNIKGMEFTVDLTKKDVEPYMKPLKHGNYYHAAIMDLSITDMNIDSTISKVLDKLGLDLATLTTRLQDASGSSSLDWTNSSGLGYVDSNDVSKNVKVKALYIFNILSAKFALKAYGIEGVDEGPNPDVVKCDGDDCALHKDYPRPDSGYQAFLSGR